jgi:hypothetical protein
MLKNENFPAWTADAPFFRSTEAIPLHLRISLTKVAAGNILHKNLAKPEMRREVRE